LKGELYEKWYCIFWKQVCRPFQGRPKKIKDAGCSIILHPFPEYDMKFYLETMKEIVSISKENGFEVYMNPWRVGKVFGGEGF
jgi:alpha/beta superfamily hydrolase